MAYVSPLATPCGSLGPRASTQDRDGLPGRPSPHQAMPPKRRARPGDPLDWRPRAPSTPGRSRSGTRNIARSTWSAPLTRRPCVSSSTWRSCRAATRPRARRRREPRDAVGQHVADRAPLRITLGPPLTSDHERRPSRGRTGVPASFAGLLPGEVWMRRRRERPEPRAVATRQRRPAGEFNPLRGRGPVHADLDAVADQYAATSSTRCPLARMEAPTMRSRPPSHERHPSATQSPPHARNTRPGSGSAGERTVADRPDGRPLQAHLRGAGLREPQRARAAHVPEAGHRASWVLGDGGVGQGLDRGTGGRTSTRSTGTSSSSSSAAQAAARSWC